jgi:hypothetical protein
MITQNPATGTNANKFNEIVWTRVVNGSFYYCFVDFNRDTADDARNTTNVADATDPATSGCGQFPWTRLSAVIEVEGAWLDGATPLDIDSDAWGEQTVASYNNFRNSAILQNPDSGDDPLKFGKVVWTALDDEGFALCVASSAQDSAALAESSATSPNAMDLAMGCNGGAWTEIDAAP